MTVKQIVSRKTGRQRVAQAIRDYRAISKNTPELREVLMRLGMIERAASSALRTRFSWVRAQLFAVLEKSQ